MANEAKQFTIGGVTHDVMDVGARQLISSLQETIDAITGGDTTTAIKTFQEVINFLDGVTDDATLIGKLNELRTLINAKYTKPNTGIPASDLADGVIPDAYTKTETDEAIADAVEGLGGGSVESVTINGQTKTPDSQGNVDLGNIVGQPGPQGPTGNCQITGDGSNIVSIIVNDLTTGGAGNIFSAEMGKRVAGREATDRQRIDTIVAILKKSVFTDDQTAAFAELDALANGIDSISFNASAHKFTNLGDTLTLSVVTDPAGKTAQVTWATSNASVATVSNGVVTAVADGNATITATTSDGKTATCKIKVETVVITGLSLNKSTLTLNGNDANETLVATTNPTGYESGVQWSSSDPTKATVDNSGKVTAVANGSAVITASIGGQTATCQVTVTGVLQTFHINVGTLSNVTVEDGQGNAITNGQAVLEGSSLTVKLVPAASHQIDTASITMGSVAQTLTDNQDGSKSVALTVSGDITVSASATYVEKDYAKASDVVDVEGYGIKYNSNGAYVADANYKHSRIIPLDFGKTYLLSGFNWASAEVVAGGCNIGLLKKTGAGTAASDFENIINGTDVTKPNNMMADSLTWNANGNIFFQSYNTDYLSRNNIIFSVPPASAFSGVEKVYLCVNYAFAAKSFDPANLSVKEIPSMNEADYNYIGIISNYYLLTEQSAVIGRIIPLEFGASYEYSGYNFPSNAATGYNMGLVANVDGIFRSLTQAEVSNIDSFFSHATYATRTSVPSTGSFTAPAQADVPAGVDKIYLAVTLKYSTFDDLSNSFTFNEAQ